MQKLRFTITHLACAGLAIAFAATGQAQNIRSFVSTFGSDLNNCTPSAHCRTFTRALAVTNPGGEIIAVDSGGYGPATIAQPVTISAFGLAAAITAGSGNALTINTTGNVTLVGLELHGEGTGNDGILVQQVGFLRIYNFTIENFANDGIEFASTGNIAIYDSKINDNTNGLAVTAAGKAFAHNVGFDNNKGAGVLASAGSMSIADSYAHFNNVAFESSGGSLSLASNHIIFNHTGLMTTTAGSSITFSYCLITQNTTPFNAFAGGTLSGSSPGTTTLTGSGTGSLSSPVALQ